MAETASRGTPQSDVYTVLLFIAFLSLLGAVGYVWYRFAELFDGNPFEVAAAVLSTLRSLVGG